MKKTAYHELFKNVKATHTPDTCDLVIKAIIITDKKNEIEKKIIDHDKCVISPGFQNFTISALR